MILVNQSVRTHLYSTISLKQKSEAHSTAETTPLSFMMGSLHLNCYMNFVRSLNVWICRRAVLLLAC